MHWWNMSCHDFPLLWNASYFHNLRTVWWNVVSFIKVPLKSLFNLFVRRERRRKQKKLSRITGGITSAFNYFFTLHSGEEGRSKGNKSFTHCSSSFLKMVNSRRLLLLVCTVMVVGAISGSDGKIKLQTPCKSFQLAFLCLKFTL